MSDRGLTVEEAYQRLLELPLDEGRLLILTHDNPDPDCIASSSALRFLLKEARGIDATVAYSGVIGRAENRAMVDALSLHPQHVMEIDFADFRYIALIDAQPFTGNTAVPDDRDVDIVLDHHPLRERTKKSMFYVVRPEIGATATMLTELCQFAGVTPPSDLATALLYGIRSETQELGREVSEADRRAYEYLFALADTSKLAQITTPTLARSYYEQLAHALDELRWAGSASVCVMGEVNDPDFVPEIADLAVRMEGIDWAFAAGSHDDHLYLSIRTREETTDAGDVMQKIISGFGRGGGHGMRAGGKIVLSEQRAPREQVERELVGRFLSAFGQDASALRPVRG